MRLSFDVDKRVSDYEEPEDADKAITLDKSSMAQDVMS